MVSVSADGEAKFYWSQGEELSSKRAEWRREGRAWEGFLEEVPWAGLEGWDGKMAGGGHWTKGGHAWGIAGIPLWLKYKLGEKKRERGRLEKKVGTMSLRVLMPSSRAESFVEKGEPEKNFESRNAQVSIWGPFLSPVSHQIYVHNPSGSTPVSPP